MAELITDEQELEFQRKISAKRRFRGLLIVVNLVLASYLIYAVGTSIYELITDTNKSKDMVTLCGKSETKSQAIYDKYVKDTVNGDFAVYGDQLHLTTENYSIGGNINFENVHLVNVCSTGNATEAKHHYQEHGDYLNKGISLFKDNSSQVQRELSEGDYIFYKDYHMGSTVDGVAIKVDAREKIEQVFYSKPIEGEKRIKTTILAYPKNPALVMKVEKVNANVENYFDAVIAGDLAVATPLKTKLEKDGLKVDVMETTNLVSLYDLNTSNVIKLTASNLEKVSVSSRVDSDFSKSNDLIFSQLGAYAFSTGDIREFYSEHKAGKMVYDVSYIDELSTQLIENFTI